MNKKPLLAITMGDPGGIGPEVIIKAVSDNAVRRLCRPLVIGDPAVLSKCLRITERRVRLLPVEDTVDLPADSAAVPVLNPSEAIGRHRWGTIRKGYGEAAMSYIRFAVNEALDGRVDGIVTAPICKGAIHRAGYSFQGHTDYLAHLTGTRRYAMMLMGKGLRVVLVTVHRAIAGVSGCITRRRVLDSITLAHEACARLGVRRPRVGVCALNPHAGEAGAFGKEEIAAIAPAIRSARRKGIDARGPFPADTLFVRRNRAEFDIVVSMYHDQGLIPLKMLAFDVGVNVTLGLPIVRTSPDHGTAFDIAGKGVADPRSMVEAIRVASRLYLNTHV